MGLSGTMSKRPREAAGSTDVPAESPAPAAEKKPDAAQLFYCSLYYYEDASQVVQGPFQHTLMRAWFDAGYILPSTQVAPSFYGEVPSTFYPVEELYDDIANAFAVAKEIEAAAAAAAELQARGPEFIESPTFSGAKDGFIFKSDLYGIGYYIDEPPAVEVTEASLKAEAADRLERAKLSRLSRPIDKHDGIGN